MSENKLWTISPLPVWLMSKNKNKNKILLCNLLSHVSETVRRWPDDNDKIDVPHVI